LSALVRGAMVTDDNDMRSKSTCGGNQNNYGHERNAILSATEFV